MSDEKAQPWLVITHDYYAGYQIEQFSTEAEARDEWDKYPHNIAGWESWLCKVIDGKDPR